MEIVVILEKIRSMYNVGSFFRTCDAVGASKLILTGYTATPPRKEISKTALDADEHVAWEHANEAVDAVNTLKKEGYTIVAAEKTETSQEIGEFLKNFSQSSDSPHDPQKHLRIACIFGNEVDGVSDEVLALADHIVHLPMLGHKESLNVAVSGGAFLYALRLHTK